MSARTASNWLPWLLKDSVVYGGAAALNKALALITFPILTRSFSVADYGAMDLFNVTANLLALAIVWGLDSAAIRFMAETDDQRTQRGIVSAALALQAGLSVVVVLLLVLGAGELAEQISAHPHAHELLLLVALQVPLLVLGNFSQGLLKWTFRRRAYLIVTIGPTVVTAAGVWLMARAGVLGLVHLFAFVLAVRCLFGLVGLWLCRGWLAWSPALVPLRRLVRFALPIGLVCVTGALVPFVERMAVVSIVGDAELGIYAVGATFAGLAALPINAFQTAWGPFSLSIFKHERAGEIFSSVARLTALVIFPLCLVLAGIAAPAIELLASAKYLSAAVVVFPLTLGLAIQGLGYVLEIGMFFAKRSDLSAWAYVAYLAGAFAGVALLAEPFGIVGVACALTLGQAARTVVACVLAERVHPLNWPAAALLLPPLLTIGAYAACTLAIPPDQPALFAALCVGSGALLALVGWRHLFSAAERRNLVAVIRPAASS